MLRIFESDRSGSIVITQNGLISYGDPEVYLKINFQNNTFRYLSAPLRTPVDVQNVASLELNTICLVGPTGAPYRAFVNDTASTRSCDGRVPHTALSRETFLIFSTA
jgi:hypothetical protein